MNARGIWAVFRFEGKRSLRPSRLLWWGAIGAVPLLLAASVRASAPAAFRHEGEVAAYLYVLVVRALPALALLLWAAPAVHTEIESRAWTYVALSPGGKVSLLLGRYLLALAWSSGVGLAALGACFLGVFQAHAERLGPLFAELVVLSSVAYGALYLLIGAIGLKRAMVAAVAYTFLVEVALTMVPAVVNQLTIDLRLRSILARDLGFSEPLPGAAREFLAAGPAWEQAAILGFYALGALAASVILIRRRQLVVAQD